MTSQLITLHDGAYTDIKKALHQWIELYSDSLEPGLQFELFKNGRGQHFIRVDNKVDNERFNYLVNYMKYPQGIDYHVTVEGFTTVRDQKIFPFQQPGAEILLFIPEDDKEHDNVYAVTQNNEVYKVGFAGKQKKSSLVKQFTQPEFNPADLPEPEIITTEVPHPETSKNRRGAKDTDNPEELEKRFRIILLIIPALFLIIRVKINETRGFLEINYVIGLGIALWLFFDYKILRNFKYYLLALLMSVGVMLYGNYLDDHYATTGLAGSFAVGTSAPFFFLVFQKPVRFLYMIIMKREPVVDRPVPSVADFIYMLVLWILMFFIFLFLSK